ncbi:MAG: adenine phosphoribosyltransferase [Candidatus Micrarchaeaceae archaeon]
MCIMGAAQIQTSIEYLKSKIRSIPDFPKPGVLYRDITPLLKDKKAFSICIDGMLEMISDKKIDYIAGIESRGFIIGAVLAERRNVGFVPIRKKGKLPYTKTQVSYKLEYGEETIEMHNDAIEKGSRVLIVDDLLATGGTSSAAARLVESLGGKVSGFAFIVELKDLAGREKLSKYDVRSLLVL